MAVYRTYQNYVLESGKYIYLVEERLRRKWAKPARLVVNAPIKFSVEKRKVYLLEEDGKEHETRVIK